MATEHCFYNGLLDYLLKVESEIRLGNLKAVAV